MLASAFTTVANYRSRCSPAPPKPQLDVATVGLYVITVVVMIMLTMSIKADIASVKDDLNKNISAVKDDVNGLRLDLKSLSNKFDKLDVKHNEVKAKNAGLDRLVVQLQNDVNIALLGRVVAGGDS